MKQKYFPRNDRFVGSGSFQAAGRGGSGKILSFPDLPSENRAANNSRLRGAPLRGGGEGASLVFVEIENRYSAQTAPAVPWDRELRVAGNVNLDNELA